MWTFCQKAEKKLECKKEPPPPIPFISLPPLTDLTEGWPPQWGRSAIFALRFRSHPDFQFHLFIKNLPEARAHSNFALFFSLLSSSTTALYFEYSHSNMTTSCSMLIHISSGSVKLILLKCHNWIIPRLYIYSQIPMLNILYSFKWKTFSMCIYYDMIINHLTRQSIEDFTSHTNFYPPTSSSQQFSASTAHLHNLESF